MAGTDIAPTIRALPKPADIAEPRPPPPRPFIAGAVSPTNLGMLAGNPVAAAPANPAVGPRIALLINIIIGDIIMLAGYMNIDTSCNGNDCTAVSAAGAAATSPCACVATADPIEATPANPAKLTGGTLNGVIAEATDAAPA